MVVARARVKIFFHNPHFRKQEYFLSLRFWFLYALALNNWKLTRIYLFLTLPVSYFGTVKILKISDKLFTRFLFFLKLFETNKDKIIIKNSSLFIYIIVYYRNYWRPSYSFLSSVGSKNRCNVNFKFDQCCVDTPLRRTSVQWTIYMGVWRNTFSTSLLSEKS